MGRFSKLLGIPQPVNQDEYRAAALSGLARPAGFLVDAFSLGGGPSDAGERVTQTKAMGLVGVFSAVYKIAEGVGALPLKVYRVVDEDRVEAKQHRMWRVLHDKPNPGVVAHAFWSTVTAQLALGGNSFLWKQRDDTGLVESLYIIPPETMQVELDASTGEKRFVQSSSEGRKVFTDEDVLHILGFSLDGVTGMSRIAYCRERLGTALARSRYESGYYARGARLPGVIEHPGRIGPDGVGSLRDSFSSVHSGTGNMHKVPVLEEGATFKAVGMSMEDMQFVENAQLTLTEIAVMFDLPPGELGGMNGGSLEYQTEELNQIRLARAIVPYTSRIQKALSNDPGILPQNVMYAEFLLEAMMRPDAKTRIEYWKGLKDMGVVDEAYIASRENLPPPPAKPEPVAPPVSTDAPVTDSNGDVIHLPMQAAGGQ